MEHMFTSLKVFNLKVAICRFVCRGFTVHRCKTSIKTEMLKIETGVNPEFSSQGKSIVCFVLFLASLFAAQGIPQTVPRRSQTEPSLLLV